MKLSKLISAAAAITAFSAIAIFEYSLDAPRVKAQANTGDAWRIQQGFLIAPVPLNFAGKDPNLVGLGSYLVNAVGDCNGCHTSDPSMEYTPTGNPFLLAPIFSGKTQVNPANYLGGGQDFGNLGGGDDIITRNLTPDKTGLAEGGHTFPEFLQIMRTGIDMDHLHPVNCSPTVTTGCVPFPFNPSLLQIMPWPTFSNMSDNDLLAIYTYLSAIPCIPGPATGVLHNDCGTPPAGPLTITTSALNAGSVTAPYSQMLNAQGGKGPYTWRVSAGRLPLGLTLNPTTGLISGTPTAQGSVIVTFQATDASSPAQTASRSFGLTVGP